jgi:acetyl-CoA carboxylase beta subunit
MQWWVDLLRECSKALEEKKKDAHETTELRFGGWELCPYCHTPVGRGELDEHCKVCKMLIK